MEFLKQITGKTKLVAGIGVLVVIILIAVCFRLLEAGNQEELTASTYTVSVEERQGLVEEVATWLVKYVVSDGFEKEINEGDLWSQFEEKESSGDAILDADQVRAIAQRAGDQYDMLLTSEVIDLNDEQVSNLQENIGDFVSSVSEAGQETQNQLTVGVSTIILNNLLVKMSAMDDTLQSIQRELDVIKENIASSNLSSSIGDVSDAIESLEDRLSYLKSNLKDSDQHLSGEIDTLEKELETLHIYVEETAHIVVELEMSMDSLTEEQLIIMSSQMQSADSAISDINSQLLAIIEKIKNLGTSDSELERIIETTTREINDARDEVSNLQKEINKSITTIINNINNLEGDIKTIKDRITIYESKFSSLQSQLDNYISSNNSKILTLGDDLEALKKRVTTNEGNIYTLQMDLIECFQYVSNGKRLLASTLTDKGVATEATATFATLSNNIALIGSASTVTADKILTGYTAYTGTGYIIGTMPDLGTVNESLNCGEMITIPAGYLSGATITANSLASQTVGTAIADNISQGQIAWVNGEEIIGNGADVEAAYREGYADGYAQSTDEAEITYIYHEHTGSSSIMGGCYTSAVYHNHSTCDRVLNEAACGCRSYNVVRQNHPYSPCEHGSSCPGWDHCNDCGHMHGAGSTCTTMVGSGYTYLCGKSTSTIEGYSLGCGKNTSTIESAIITFN